jgi:hypothetical protein
MGVGGRDGPDSELHVKVVECGVAETRKGYEDDPETTISSEGYIYMGRKTSNSMMENGL